MIDSEDAEDSDSEDSDSEDSEDFDSIVKFEEKFEEKNNEIIADTQVLIHKSRNKTQEKEL